jgi:arginyl-tRNA synthetase
MIRKRIAAIIKEAGDRCIERGIFPPGTEIKPIIEVPKEPEHGDYSTNLAFLLARSLRRSPEAIAKTLIECMDFESVCTKVDVAAKGFVNFYVRDEVYRSALKDVAEQGLELFLPHVGEGKRVLIEFVSANPTGPLHVGHGRGAAVGDVLANLLRKAGFDVVTEYYVNDAGRQIETLGRSVYLRWKEISGENIDSRGHATRGNLSSENGEREGEAGYPRAGGALPQEGATRAPVIEYDDNLYKGAYVREIASRMNAEGLSIPEEEPEAIRFMARYAAEVVLAGIRKDLEDFGVRFDNYYHERTLFEEGYVDGAIEMLKKAGYLYEQEGALWFTMAEKGDEKDRVIIKSDGEKTYFASDIAYHSQKFARKFGILIDIWGSDHHGYIPRLKASMEALGQDMPTAF